jgi:hypothetical protein
MFDSIDGFLAAGRARRPRTRATHTHTLRKAFFFFLLLLLFWGSSRIGLCESQTKGNG